MTDLAGKWDTLSDAQQQNISFQIAATRQTNILTAMLENYTDAQKLANKADADNGSAMKNQEKYLKTSTAQIQQIKDNISEFWIKAFNSKVTEGVLSTIKSITGALSGMQKQIGTTATTILTVVTALRTVSAVKTNIGGILGDGGAIAKTPGLLPKALTFLAGGKTESGERTGGVAGMLADLFTLKSFRDNVKGASGTRSFGTYLKQKLLGAKESYSDTHRIIRNPRGENVARNSKGQIVATMDLTRSGRTSPKRLTPKADASKIVDTAANAGMGAEATVSIGQKLTGLLGTIMKFAPYIAGITAAIAGIVAIYKVLNKETKDYNNALDDEKEAKEKVSKTNKKIDKLQKKQATEGLTVGEKESLKEAKTQLGAEKASVAAARQAQLHSVTGSYKLDTDKGTVARIFTGRQAITKGSEGYRESFNQAKEYESQIKYYNNILKNDNLSNSQKKDYSKIVKDYKGKLDELVPSLTKVYDKMTDLKAKGAEFSSEDRERYNSLYDLIDAYNDLSEAVEDSGDKAAENQRKFSDAVKAYQNDYDSFNKALKSAKDAAGGLKTDVGNVNNEGDALKTYNDLIGGAVKDAKGTVDGTSLFWKTAEGVLSDRWLTKNNYDFGKTMSKMSSLQNIDTSKGGIKNFLDLIDRVQKTSKGGSALKDIGVSLEKSSNGIYKLSGINTGNLQKFANILGLSKEYTEGLVDATKRYMKFKITDPGKLGKDLQKLTGREYSTVLGMSDKGRKANKVELGKNGTGNNRLNAGRGYFFGDQLKQSAIESGGNKEWLEERKAIEKQGGKAIVFTNTVGDTYEKTTKRLIAFSKQQGKVDKKAASNYYAQEYTRDVKGKNGKTTQQTVVGVNAHHLAEQWASDGTPMKSQMGYLRYVLKNGGGLINDKGETLSVNYKDKKTGKVYDFDMDSGSYKKAVNQGLEKQYNAAVKHLLSQFEGGGKDKDYTITAKNVYINGKPVKDDDDGKGKGKGKGGKDDDGGSSSGGGSGSGSGSGGGHGGGSGSGGGAGGGAGGGTNNGNNPTNRPSPSKTNKNYVPQNTLDGIAYYGLPYLFGKKKGGGSGSLFGSIGKFFMGGSKDNTGKIPGTQKASGDNGAKFASTIASAIKGVFTGNKNLSGYSKTQDLTSGKKKETVTASSIGSALTKFFTGGGAGKGVTTGTGAKGASKGGSEGFVGRIVSGIGKLLGGGSGKGRPSATSPTNIAGYNGTGGKYKPKSSKAQLNGDKNVDRYEGQVGTTGKPTKKGGKTSNNIKIKVALTGNAKKGLKDIESSKKKASKPITIKAKVSKGLTKGFSEIAKLKSSLGKKPVKIGVKVNGKGAASQLNSVAKAKSNVKKGGSKITITAKANTKSASGALSSLAGKLKNVKSAASSASSAIASVSNQLAQLNAAKSPHVDIYVTTHKTTVKSAKGRTMMTDGESIVGEAGPELVTPKDRELPPYVVGQGGQETRLFSKGDIITSAGKTREVLAGNRPVPGRNDEYIGARKTGTRGKAPKSKWNSFDWSGYDKQIKDLEAQNSNDPTIIKAIQDYYDNKSYFASELKKANAKGIDLDRTQYGNINTNKRQLIKWTDDEMEDNKAALMSWNRGRKWSQVKKDYRNSTSSDMGSWTTIGNTNVVFSPLLQTKGDKPTLLSDKQFNKYLSKLSSKAMKSARKKGRDDWSDSDLIKADKNGLTMKINGKKTRVKGLIAGLTDNTKKGRKEAETLSESMHYTGKTGSLALAVSDAKKAVSTGKKKSNNTKKNARKNAKNAVPKKTRKSTKKKAQAKAGGGEARSGWALTGEDGRELVQSGDEAYVVGDDGPEMTYLNEGDYVYDNDETESILSRVGNAIGSVFGSRKNGTDGDLPDDMDLVETTTTTTTHSLARKNSGPSYTATGNFAGVKNKVTKSKTNKSGKSNGKSKSNGKGKSGNGKSGSGSRKRKSSGSKKSSKSKQSSTQFDWIERAIKKIERAIDSLDRKGSSVHRSYQSRFKSINKENRKLLKEINLLGKASDYYMKKANSVTVAGKSKKVKTKGKNGKTTTKTVKTKASAKQQDQLAYYEGLVRNGKIKIDTIKDEKLANAIQKYQDYYDKATDARDKAAELRETRLNNIVNKFDLTVEKYEHATAKLEHAANMSSKQEQWLETMGRMGNHQLYQNNIENAQQTRATLFKELADLRKQRNQYYGTTLSSSSGVKNEKAKNQNGSTKSKVTTGGKGKKVTVNRSDVKKNGIKKQKDGDTVVTYKDGSKEVIKKGSKIKYTRDKRLNGSTKKTRTIGGKGKSVRVNKDDMAGKKKGKKGSTIITYSDGSTATIKDGTKINYYSKKGKDGKWDNGSKKKNKTLTRKKGKSLVVPSKNLKKTITKGKSLICMYDDGSQITIKNYSKKKVKFKTNNGVSKNSDEYQKMQEQINSTKESIADTYLTEADNRMKDIQIEWDKWDKVIEYMNNVNDEADAMINHLGRKDLYNTVDSLFDNEIALGGTPDYSNFDQKIRQFKQVGKLNEQGLATLGLRVSKVQELAAVAAKYRDLIDDTQKEVEKDPYNTILRDRLETYRKSLNDTNASIDDEKDAIKSLITDGYQAMIDALNKLIDKRKVALQTTKDLYDYESNMSDKTKQLASYQKQLAAISGDNSEETQSRRQQLEKSIKDAQKDIQDTEYDRWLTDQTNMLDDLSERMEAVINARTKDVEKTYEEALKTVADNGTEINDTIKKTADSNGQILSQNFITTVGSIKDVSGNVKEMSDKFNDNLTSIATSLKAIVDGNGLPNLLKDDSKSGGNNDPGVKGQTVPVGGKGQKIVFDNTQGHTQITRNDDGSYLVTGENGANYLVRKGTQIFLANRGNTSGTSSKGYNLFDYTNSKLGTDASSSAGGALYYGFDKDKQQTNIEKHVDIANQGQSWKVPKAVKNAGLSSSGGTDSTNLASNADLSIHAMLKRRGYKATDTTIAKLYKSVFGKKYEDTEAQNNKLRDWMRGKGFAKGGTVGDLVRSTGEDGFVLARTGEEVLSVPKLKLASETVDKLIRANVETPNVSSLKGLESNLTAGLNINIEEMNLPNVTNSKEFASNLMNSIQNDKKVQKAVRSISVDLLKGSNTLNVRKF